MNKVICALVPVLVLLVVPGNAGVVTSLPGGTVIDMPIVEYFGPGPQTFGGGIIWTSTNAANQSGSVFGYDEGYGFGDNGFWDSSMVMAGVNDSYGAFGVVDTMTFEFPNPVYGVGGFLNYVPNGPTPTTIAVYDSGNNLIESFDLTFLTGGGTDTGAFYGFLESSPIIKYFTLSDNYIGITDLTVQGQGGIPEPASLLLVSSALLLAGAFRRRRVL